MAWREAYQRENDTEYLYFIDRLELDPEGRIGGGELYGDYRIWCENNGFKPKNNGQVAKDWRRLGLTDSRIGGKTAWKGAKLRTT